MDITEVTLRSKFKPIKRLLNSDEKPQEILRVYDKYRDNIIKKHPRLAQKSLLEDILNKHKESLYKQLKLEPDHQIKTYINLDNAIQYIKALKTFNNKVLSLLNTYPVLKESFIKYRKTKK